MQMNVKEINLTILQNIMKMLERRKLINSWETEFNNCKDILATQTIVEFILKNKVKCSLYIINAKLTTIVSKTPLDHYLTNNIDMHKIVVIRDVLKKVVKQIIHEYKNAEFFFESEMLEDLPSKEMIPHHEIIGEEEKKELLGKYSEGEFSKILNTDIMCRYYGGKIGDIFKIIRPSFTAGYSIAYRRVAPGSIDVMF